MADIHQITEISSITIIDVWEPTEEGLDVVEQQRRVSVIQITLSKEPLDTSHIGYQPPLPADQVRSEDCWLWLLLNESLYPVATDILWPANWILAPGLDGA